MRWLFAIVLILAVVAFFLLGGSHYLSWEFVRANIDHWKTLVDQHLIASVVFFFLLYVGVTALSLPAATVLSLVGGALFGRWLGTAVVSVAATVGATLAFLSSRYLLRDWVQQRFGSHLRIFNEGIQRDGAVYLFTLRLVPLVPYFVINLGMGLTAMPALTFALVSWLGMLLGALLYVNAGTELSNLDSPRGLISWPVLGSLALLGIVPVLIRWFMRPRHVEEPPTRT